jgi:hypothetical protein
VTLADVPDEPLDTIRRRGFHGIWLMGVWSTGPAGRAEALRSPGLLAAYEKVLPDWDPTDVEGSPFSIRSYEPPPALGGLEELARLRERMHERELGLILDFVPNHLARDHRWRDERPELLVQGSARDLAREPENWYAHPTPGGEFRVLAHGRDPHFPGWSDTCQVDYRSTEARRAMSELFRDLASRCDGLRCDVAMLVLPDIFRKTWGERGGGAGDDAGDFWSTAIPELRREHPDIVLIAEVYWGLEERLVAAGFDFAYDKDFTDKIIAGDLDGLRARVGEPRERHEHRLRFLENHDEPRAMEVLGAERSRAAAVLAATLPGARFFQEGQESGRRIHVPVQLARAPVEPVDEASLAFYERLFEALTAPVFHRGHWSPLEIRDADPPGEASGLLGSVWRDSEEIRLAVANLGETVAKGRVPLPDVLRSAGSRETRGDRSRDPGTLTIRDELSGRHLDQDLHEVTEDGLIVEVERYGSRIFVIPARRSAA